MWELDCEESWVLKNWCFWTVVLEKTLESPLDCKEIQPVHSEGDQPWVFFGRNDAKAETPGLWPPHAKSWLIGKDSDAGRDWGQEEKGMTEVEMAGWHHRLDGHEFGWIPGAGDVQGGLACCDSWGRKESDTTERLDWTELRRTKNYLMPETNAWFWVTRSPQDSALSPPLPRTLPVCPHLLLCWNTNNFRECASCLAWARTRHDSMIFPLDGFCSSQTPHCKLTLFSPGRTSSSRNIFLSLFTGIPCSWPQKLTVFFGSFCSFAYPVNLQVLSSLPQITFFFFSLHFYCWSLLTWITLQSLNSFLYDLAHSILPTYWCQNIIL